jgi:hypothetical protein
VRLLEISAVPLPADSGALAQARSRSLIAHAAPASRRSFLANVLYIAPPGFDFREEMRRRARAFAADMRRLDRSDWIHPLNLHVGMLRDEAKEARLDPLFVDELVDIFEDDAAKRCRAHLK